MIWVAASAVALAAVAVGDATAQRMVMPGPGAGYGAPRVGTPMGANPAVVGGGPRRAGGRWGSKVDGRWWAGANAPGGWHGYHRLGRGRYLPGYWNSPSFYVGDWSTYGLGEPPVGYNWSRYYDDAVLVDGRGQVYDCVDGIDWDRGGAGDDGEGGYAGAGYAPPPAPYPGQPYATAGYPGAGYAQPYPPQGPAYVERRNSGVGGALVGAAVGGVAGNLIAGRGNRLAGTLVGAGVGGAAGYAIDRSHGHPVPVAPGAGYAYPDEGYAGGAYPPPPPPPPPPGPPPGATGVWRSPDGGTTISTTSVGGYGGGSTTVVTVQTAPVVTTTTTEIVEDNVTWSRPHRHYRPVRHKWVRRSCGC